MARRKLSLVWLDKAFVCHSNENGNDICCDLYTSTIQSLYHTIIKYLILSTTMQYQVPQFIEFEDKIFGPLTLKQFIYIAGGLAISFLLYVTLPFIIAIILIAPVASFCFALAFYKPDGHRPFIFMVEQASKYYLGSKLYIWKRTEKKHVQTENKENKESEANDLAGIYIPKLSNSKLKELSWSLDIHSAEASKNTPSDFKI